MHQHVIKNGDNGGGGKTTTRSIRERGMGKVTCPTLFRDSAFLFEFRPCRSAFQDAVVLFRVHVQGLLILAAVIRCTHHLQDIARTRSVSGL